MNTYPDAPVKMPTSLSSAPSLSGESLVPPLTLPSLDHLPRSHSMHGSPARSHLYFSPPKGFSLNSLSASGYRALGSRNLDFEAVLLLTSVCYSQSMGWIQFNELPYFPKNKTRVSY